jgi:TolB protein
LLSRLSPGLPTERPTHGRGHNLLPAYSPDGSKVAFASNRDGNYEIYVMHANGSAVVRLTRSAAIDVAPAWSPDGARIAFVSDRSGRPQIHVLNATDGSDERQLTHEKSCDRPAWAPAPFNEIAYTSRTRPGVLDIRILDVSSGAVRDVTDGHGRNESATYAPNGRHLAFVSTRAGREQIFTIARDGTDLRQITRGSANSMPSWSPR